jgi:hypothetical protein
MEPPLGSTTDQVTAVFELLSTTALKVREAPAFKGPEGPNTMTVTGEVTVIVAVPDFVVSSTLVAFTVAVVADAGAV